MLWAVLKSYCLLLHPQELNQPPTSIPSPPALPRICPHTPRHILLCHSPLLSPPIPLLHHPPSCRAYWTIHPSSAASPRSSLVCQCGREQDGGADFTVVDRKKMRKGTTERRESNQQALRGTGGNIDRRWLQQASLSFRSHSQSKVLQWPQ